MESTREKLFYDALGVVPEVPAGILENVERRVRRSGVKRRLALAACFLLAFIIPALLLNQGNTSVAYAEEYESMDKLLYAFEFLSGGSPNLDCLLDIAAGDGVGLDDQGLALSDNNVNTVTKNITGKERSNED
jgi:hypothetical protein